MPAWKFDPYLITDGLPNQYYRDAMPVSGLNGTGTQ